jgi:hypothetical protein
MSSAPLRCPLPPRATQKPLRIRFFSIQQRMSLSPLLAAGLAEAAARDQRKLDLLRMTRHFDCLQSFRPESVCCAAIALLSSLCFIL